MHRRRCRAAALALGLAASLLVPLTAAAPPAAAATPGAKKVIVQLFEWNWTSVAAECTSTLGPKGYGYVQVSPPQEHVNSSPWWVSYQPVSYRIESRKGTRAQFQSMVNTCHAAGVKVIVDAVVNHMSGQENGGTGWAGSSYGHYNYPGVYSAQDFHYCGRNGNNDIANYNDRYEVQNCELVNLADLKTESEYVRGRLAAYLNDLLSLGVDGFRLDGSKHMPAADIAAIKAKLNRSAYLVQEVIYGAGEPIQPTEYTGNGDVHEFRYGKDLARMFNNERLAYLRNFGESWGYLSSAKAVVFTDNHDTQREGGVLTYRNRGTYALANAFMLAWPYGTPAVMSSFTYSGRDQGPPADGSNRITNVTCYSGWECEHRWPVIANMVGFRNATEGAGVSNWYDNGYQHIAFSRTGKGYLTINDEDSAVNGRSYYTGLPAGRYCDVIHGTFSNGSCSGPVITVDSSGWFAANIAAHDGIAIHIGAKLS
ncbi:MULTISPECIES: alpha-amylase [Micromonospora]|uniref:Alpha-amylase n=1 Tax=Micromonospora aurantiaca (nom. illeg.) TaxID=47850 RepID=A0A3M9KLW2_9ACTN|nr:MULTISPECIES: alpha-amylase family protein [Micromonospora]AXH88441.1 ATPase [Micromonospora aurantiaca]KAB1102921.1 ATPase [Micromonospora aurantiaca]MBC9005331.1 alpha-amylase family protein [Micromonospora aurantiaca]MDG4753537.1 alpha-amylase family protein [Micromonospora sp. WMMD718]RNI01991.1 ATPase [Micromonospora aurantiaca]